DNRTFTVNQDTTLAWKWFNDEPAAAEYDTFTVTLTLNSATLENITDSTASVYMVGDFNGWALTDPVTISLGDYHTGSIEVIGPSTGKDILYKFMYVDAVDDQYWEAPGGDPFANRSVTISSDTTFFNYWNDIEPFTPTDSIDVWFRVNMSGVATFDPSAGDVVGIRGAIPPTNWDATLPLDREADTYYYSGLYSFANASQGNTIAYKFVWGDAPNWESKISDRTFTLNEDTTLAFKYFDNEPPAGQIVEAVVVFSVDVGAYETMGVFSVDRDDTVQVRGGFNSWAGAALPDQSNLVMLRIPGTTIYQRSIAMTKFVGSTDEYKYYIKLSQTSLDLFTAIDPYFHPDWQYENPADWGGANRMFTFEGNPDTPQQLDLEYYAGVPPLGLIPAGDTVSITFTVDMRPFITAATPLFNPATDSVWWIPQDEWTAHVLEYYRIADHQRRPNLKMAPTAANDSIYTVTFDYLGPVPYTMVYVYEWGNTGDGYEQEGGGFAAGRYRARYIQPEASGPVWPRNYVVPTDLAQLDPPLIQEDPPDLVYTGIAEGLLPMEFSVSQNFPNPFNPTTEIQFTLPKADKVTFTIYNLLGQQVATLSQHFPGAGIYAFRWHGRNQAGVEVPSGIYFYVVKTSEHRVTKKMTLLK
ncbi:MAG: T9SS type A sorting domain-containing protein, partial [Fidelibacterota bacterium]